MRDPATGQSRPTDARLAESDSDDAAEATPLARDERFWLADQEEHTEEPATADIEDWVEEYKENPLIRTPIRLYVSDVVEPGYDVAVRPADPTADTEGYDEPTVPEEYPNATYHDLTLSDALTRWLSRSVITGESFDRDFRVLMEQVLTDAVGRRGAGLVEHVYGDPTERRRLLGLRPFKVETVTAYTRRGKAILLRPDDTAQKLNQWATEDNAGFQPRRAPTLGTGDGVSRDDIPKTAAEKTAALVQYDDIYGGREREEIPFALDDVTILSNDPDTGEIFGRPETASVVPRATALRTQLDDIDQGLKNAAWNNIVANVSTDDKTEAQEMLSGLDPNSPDSISVTNTNPEITELNGEVPDVVSLIQQEVEYVISGLPVSLYRVGFEGEINRDVTGEQSDDYQDQLARARRRLEATFRQLLELKAREFLTGHAHPEDADANELYGDPSDVPDVALRVRPDGETNPLRSEHFDAQAFLQLMQGLKQGAPGGQVSQVLTPRAMLDLVPGLDPDEVLPDATQEAEAMRLDPLDEADPAVRETFADVMDIEEAALATRYSESDVVETPDGIGVVAAVMTEAVENEDLEDADGVPNRIDASADSPMYGVVLEDETRGVGFYKASDLEASEIETDVDPLGDVSEEADAACPAGGGEMTAELAWSPPQSWREAETPARLIAMDAFASMGGKHGGGEAGGCTGTMQGKVADADRWCAGFLDYLYGGYDYWRGDSFLPGD